MATMHVVLTILNIQRNYHDKTLGESTWAEKIYRFRFAFNVAFVVIV